MKEEEKGIMKGREGKERKTRERVCLSKSRIQAHYSGTGWMSQSWFGVNVLKSGLTDKKKCNRLLTKQGPLGLFGRVWLTMGGCVCWVSWSELRQGVLMSVR